MSYISDIILPTNFNNSYLYLTLIKLYIFGGLQTWPITIT